MNTREYIERLPQTMGSVSACERLEHTVYENVHILVRSHFAASVCTVYGYIKCKQNSLRFVFVFSVHIYIILWQTHTNTYPHTHSDKLIQNEKKKTDASQQLPVVFDYTFQSIQHICLWVTFFPFVNFMDDFG